MLTILIGSHHDLDSALSSIISKSSADPERPDTESLTPADLPSLFLGTTLFAESRLIILKNFSENKSTFATLEQYLDQIDQNPDTHIVLLESKLDKRTTLYKKLKPYITEFADFSSKSLPEQLKWLTKSAETQNLTLSRPDLEFLLNWVGADQGKLLSALEKLSLAYGISTTPSRNPSRRITQDGEYLATKPVTTGLRSGDGVDGGEVYVSAQKLIQDIIPSSPEQNVFTIFNLAFTDTPATLQAIDRLALTSEPPQKFFGLISNQAFLLAALVFADRSSDPSIDVARDFAVSPFVLRSLRPLAVQLTPAQARKLLQLFAATDRDLKSTRLDPWLLIKTLLTKLPML